MNFCYELKDIQEPRLGISIKPNPLIQGDYTLLEICLTEDVGDYDFILMRINDVLNGSKEIDTYGGDLTDARFDKDITVISYEELVISNPAKCTLPTWLFREIVEVWLKEAKKHFEETHKAD